MTIQQRIEQLKRLIDLTHKHGVKLQEEIVHLQRTKPRGWPIQVAAKRALGAGLKALNLKRRIELARLERKPVPKPPTPKPPPAQPFTMYDAANASTGFPTNTPQAVAGYINGLYQTYWALVKRFPHAKHYSISINASTDADILDVETGDATPAQAPGWVRKQHARGVKRPRVYANASTMPTVIAALEHDSIKRDEFLLWVADYDNVASIPAGYDAKQYKNVEVPGHNYDVSLCHSYF